MPFHETTPNALLEKANEERCLVHFLDQPLTYCLSDEFDLVIDYYHVDDLPSELHEWTFQLVKSNLHNLYVQSQMGWDDTHKRKEMLESRTRYLIARSRTNPSDLKGFLSFQLLQEETMDDDIMANTAYCFEIQLEPHARSKGLGEYLMNLLWEIGCYWKMDKVMLTVFKANQGAFRFYTEKLGFKLDEISPSACLPLYKAKKFDYELLSKPCQ